MADMNRFILASGAIPTHAWLDGTSEGEQSIEELLAVAMGTGAAALNIIPDRNYTPGVKDQKVGTSTSGRDRRTSTISRSSSAPR